MTLKNNWAPGEQFFSSDANTVATQVNTNTTNVAAAAAAAAVAATAASTAQTTADGKQPADADLTAIATLTPADGDTLLRIAGAWANRTMAQLKTALALVKADVGLGNVDNVADASKPVSTAQAAADTAVLASANGHADTGDASTLASANSHADTGLAAKLGHVQAAKNPDVLVTGAITVDGNDLITSAAVVWPDGSPGILTITSRDANDAVLAYAITYGSPVTNTYNQPTITRNATGAATNIPAIVVS